MNGRLTMGVTMRYALTVSEILGLFSRRCCGSWVFQIPVTEKIMPWGLSFRAIIASDEFLIYFICAVVGRVIRMRLSPLKNKTKTIYIKTACARLNCALANS